jgi:homoserine kinase type II
MAVFTSLNIVQIQSYINIHFPHLGEVIVAQGIQAGIENTNYFVHTRKSTKDIEEPIQKWVLTIFERLTKEQLPYYLGLMDYFANNNIPCPQPLKSIQTQEWIFDINNKPAVLATCLSGKSEDYPNEEQCFSMGKMLAQMHQVSLNYEQEQHRIEQVNLRGISWWASVIPQVSPFLNEEKQKVLHETWLEQLFMMQSNDYVSLPRGAVHADLFRDNALIENNQISGVIDFYFAGHDTLLFDFCVCSNDWCIDALTGELNQERYQAFLTAYESIRPFQNNEKKLLNLVFQTAAMRFWLSRLYDYYLPREAALIQAKNPDHFYRVLIARKKLKN